MDHSTANLIVRLSALSLWAVSSGALVSTKLPEQTRRRSWLPAGITGGLERLWSSANLGISLAAAVIAGIYNAVIGGADKNEIAGVFVLCVAFMFAGRFLWQRIRLS